MKKTTSRLTLMVAVGALLLLTLPNMINAGAGNFSCAKKCEAEFLSCMQNTGGDASCIDQYVACSSGCP